MTNRIDHLLGSGEVIDEMMIHGWLQDQAIIFGDEITTIKTLIKILEVPESLEIYLYEPEQIDPSLLEGLEIQENLSGAEIFRLCLLHILKQRLLRSEPN